MAIKLNYLSMDEFGMQPAMVDLQTAMGLSSCEKLGDVIDLLCDVRLHERVRVAEKIKDLIETREVNNLTELVTWLNALTDGLRLLGDSGAVEPAAYDAQCRKTRH